MTVVGLAVLVVVCTVVAFVTGRSTGRYAAGEARSAERLEAERRLHEESQHRLRAEERAASAAADRDRVQQLSDALRAQIAEVEKALSIGGARLAATEAESRGREEQLGETRARLTAAEAQGRQLQEKLRETAAALEGARTQIEIEAAESEKKLKLLAEAEEKLGNQFKVLAAEIFQEKSKRFREESEASLGGLLNPLKERMGEFQKKVEALQQDGVVGRTELREQLGNLRALNEQLSSEASNLVRALKGSSKAQGDWGEFVLEQMLESAGLRRGEQFLVQTSYAGAEGGQARPDVVLNLPGRRHLVVDAKVSLVDYSSYCECEDENSRAAALGRHVGSIRAHIKGLSAKNYPGLYGLESIDFVVMFVPIEPAFLLAIARDGALWQEAWEKDVLLVSPSTLLFVLRTVAHLWQREQQQRNVQEIVRRGGELYDKLALFAKDLSDVGTKLGDAQKAYDGAYSKLARGKGNAIRQAEMLRALGARASKQMPRDLVDATQEELLAELSAGSDMPALDVERG